MTSTAAVCDDSEVKVGVNGDDDKDCENHRHEMDQLMTSTAAVSEDSEVKLDVSGHVELSEDQNVIIHDTEVVLSSILPDIDSNSDRCDTSEQFSGSMCEHV